MYKANFWKRKFLGRGSQYSIPTDIPTYWHHVILNEGERKLAVRYWSADCDDGKVVILMHPYRKEAKDYFLHTGHADFYHQLGFHVVIFDANGFGESEDIDFNFGEDVRMIYNFCHQKWNIHLLTGHGISFGGAVLINGLAGNVCHFDKAIIENCLDHAAHYYKSRNRSLYFISLFLFPFVPSANRFFSYYRRIREVKKPGKLLLIYCKIDDLTTVSMGRRLQQNMKVQGELHVLEGNHMEAITRDTEKYFNLLRNYLEE